MPPSTLFSEVDMLKVTIKASELSSSPKKTKKDSCGKSRRAERLELFLKERDEMIAELQLTRAQVSFVEDILAASQKECKVYALQKPLFYATSQPPINHYSIRRG